RIRELKCEHAEEIIEAVRVVSLDRRGDLVMKLTALLQKDALVGGVMNKSVLEGVLELRHASPLANETGRVEVPEGTIGGDPIWEERAQQAISKCPADDRGYLQHLAAIRALSASSSGSSGTSTSRSR